MNDSPGIVIAGAGQAAFQLAASLRDFGDQRRIVMIGEESHAPYQRPPLSKTHLTDTGSDSKLAFRAESFYSEKQIELRTGRRVVALHRHRRKAVLDDGDALAYEHFVFAVGARNRKLTIPGSDLRGVHYLRSLDEAQALRAALRTAKSMVVIGAGFIGLEVAATAAKLGIAVTVIEVADRPMARALSTTMSAIFADQHTQKGLRLLFGTQVLRLLGEARQVRAVEVVSNADAPTQQIAADLVLVGIGVVPNTELAAAAGLAVGNGIVVDQTLATSDPQVSAMGDCALHPNVYAAGDLVRLESVQNAIEQARCIAARLTGKTAHYDNIPWFWSDQGNLKLQIAGLSSGADQAVLRGDVANAACSVYCFKAGQLLAVETVNRPAEHLQARRLITQRIALTPAQAADPSFDIKALIVGAQAPG